MKKVIFVSFLFLPQLMTLAQTVTKERIEKTRYEMVKSSIEFLASDRETFKKVKNEKCLGCATKNDLLAFIDENKINGAKDKLKEWEALPIPSADSLLESSLNEYKNKMKASITGGNRSYRAKGAAFDDYKNTLDSLVSATLSSPSPLTPTEGPVLGADTVPTKQNNTTAVASQPLSNQMNASSIFGFLPAITADTAYISMLILLFILLFLWWRLLIKSREVKQLHVQKNRRQMEEEKERFNVEQSQKDLHKANEKLAIYEKERASLEEDLRAERDRNRRLEEQTLPVEAPVRQSAPKTTTKTKYARYADQGDGFSAPELLDQENSETIFELTIVDDYTAYFKISDNIEAQQYALTNTSYFLGKTSHYDHFPSGHSSIQTLEPGELKLRDTKWVIVKPVKISFS